MDREDTVVARDCLAQAVDLSRCEVESPTAKSLAGRACAESAQGTLAHAQAHVAEILALLDRGDMIGISNRPFWIYLTCYRVLAAAGDPRAAQVLALAYRELLEWADRCPDEETRRSFLENVPWNRQVVQEWQLAHPGEGGD